MKKIFLPILIITFFGCSGNTNDDTSNATQDSINAIEDHPAQDTQVAPFPDGYTPPNAKTDSSQRVKDSVDTLNH